ncbi:MULTISPECIES: RagB/SusD family nutrient uptake outer membrane protein [Butyricimonas]|uniref:RagB/SusD family nutrient uptake outer membrane protein n=1 Tax=Butyricimonas TaxID=574697 RepID=UPI001D07AD61|nr:MULTISPECIES: RagB/SusD family nutrient uptake outer membrane protein [Butyricimonas]MCB6974793.1 RagB/SusD family nutrient uptake outer membrane protein [Butyricimonas synergistica]MCG4521535.1 RagB/SusD family nutrient uptake outer membrane protein [Butyricimonas sp. DFI.6.44]
MKKYLLFALWIGGFVGLGGCSNWLDVVPENDIETIETDFEKRENAEKWLWTCYVFMEKAVAQAVYPNSLNPAFLGADEFCGREYARKQDNSGALYIGDGLQMSQNPYCNVWHKNQYWAAIRYCNIFLENIDHVYTMKEDEKKVWAAEVKALKAFYYFDLMRRYGPIVLIDENVNPNVEFEDMQQFRRPIDECVEAIVKLCDEAMRDLPYQVEKPSDHQLFFNKEATATLKALTLLYAASPLFNGNTILQNFYNKKGEKLFPTYNKEKWKRAAEACDSAILICEAAGKKLVTGSGDRPTALLNTMQDIEKTWIGDVYDSPEAILTINNNTEKLVNLLTPAASSVYTDYYDPSSAGCLGAPLKMVEMFYTDHGLPIEEDRLWMNSKYNLTEESDEKYRHVLPLNTKILSLHCRREPRFYAMIAGDRMIWYRKHGTGSTPYTDVEIQTRQGETLGMISKRFDENEKQNITGYWIKKWQSSDYTLRNYSTNVSTLKKPRYVFRLAELYLAAAEAWNEYLDAPDSRVYAPLNKVRERAGILKVEDAWKNYAKNPGKVTTRDGMREIIQQEWNIEFMFEGRRYWNLRRWMTAPQELNIPQLGWNVTSSTQEGFYNNFEGPIVAWPKRKFESPKDYFTPIRAEEILISGVVQNPGW